MRTLADVVDLVEDPVVVVISVGTDAVGQGEDVVDLVMVLVVGADLVVSVVPVEAFARGNLTDNLDLTKGTFKNCVFCVDPYLSLVSVLNKYLR